MTNREVIHLLVIIAIATELTALYNNSPALYIIGFVLSLAAVHLLMSTKEK